MESSSTLLFKIFSSLKSKFFKLFNIFFLLFLKIILQKSIDFL